MQRLHLLLAALAVLAVVPASASAAIVSGTVKGGRGMEIVAVQANGIGKSVTLPASGRFRLAIAPRGATLHLVKGNGDYHGPIVLAGSGRKAQMTLWTRRAVNIGTVTRKRGYARAKAPKGSYATAPAYTATARRGVPIGSGRVGLVKVGNGTSPLKGYNGQGRDADLDGIVGAFDVDDNGNLIIDNVDRSGRIGRLIAPRAARQAIPPGPPGPVPTPTEFRMFSNFKLTGPESVNLYLGGSAAAIRPLIERTVPSTVTLATQVMDGSSGVLDCLGNIYCGPHVLNGFAYPIVNGGAPRYSSGMLELAVGPTGDAQIAPGALPSEIGAGDAFVQSSSGSSYPGVLNFVFNTAPAVRSYQVTGGAETILAYDPVTGTTTGAGMTPSNPILVGTDGLVTLTWWRPQRPVGPGEVSATGYMDMGRLLYTADAPNKPNNGGPRTGTNTCTASSYSNTVSNGVPFTSGTTLEGVLDPAADAPTDLANPAGRLLQYTIDARTCFGADWVGAAGATFDFDIQARSVYGDNAARKLYFRVR